MKKSNFTIPKVVKYDDLEKPWYVYFRYNGQKIVYKKGINYIKNYNKRLSEANALATALHEKLKKKWNPLIPDAFDTSIQMNLVQALDFALEKKKTNLSPKTYLDYRVTIRFIKTSIEALSLNYIPVQEVKRVHIKTILEKVKEQRTATNNSFNKYLDHFRAVLSELIQWDIIEFNPANKIKNLSVAESRANIPATPNQHILIKDELLKNHYNFFNFIATLFHTGIRPKEILQIKLGMINLDNYEIILPPEITKKNKERIVPINNHLRNIFISMDFQSLPTSFYLFGSFREPGKGNVGPKLDFIPGPTNLSRDTATRRWEKIVKIGLGIRVNMYSEKHRGANAKILANVELDALKELYGHTSKLTTMIYATKVREIYRKQIIENSPEY